MHTGFWWGDLGIDGLEGMDWIELAQIGTGGGHL
jgi:hypothetical protein